MSTFKLKPEKVRYVTEIKTLDETHRKIVKEFQRKKNMLPKQKEKLQRMKNKLEKMDKMNGTEYTNDDIKLRSKLKSDIEQLEEEIYDIENNISEIDYYSKTEELLMDYYEIFDDEDETVDNEHQELDEDQNDKKEDKDKIDQLDYLNKLNKHKQKKITKRRKRIKNIGNNQNNIMDYFGCSSEAEKTNIEKKDKIKDKSEILDQFRMLIDNEYICDKGKNLNFIKKCNECGVDKTLIQSEGIYVCMECGEVEMVIIESERPNYKDIIPEKPGYPYKRIMISSEKHPTIYIQSSVYRKMVESLVHFYAIFRC